MREPSRLTIEIVEDIHAEVIARFGGSIGLRERTLLESTLAWAENKFAYGEVGLAAFASAYAFGLS